MSHRVSPKFVVLVATVLMLLVLMPAWVARAGYPPISDTYARAIYDLTDDNHYLAFIGVNSDDTANLYRVDLTTNQRVTLRGGNQLRGGDQVRIAPNQLKVYFSQGSSTTPTANSANLYKININGGGDAQLASSYSRIDLQDAASTPDGRYLAFTAAKVNTPLLRPLVVDTQTDSVGNLLPPSGEGGADNSFFLATPDNTRFVYIYRASPSAPAQLVSVPVMGGNLTVLSPDNARNVSDVVLSPDEAYLYYFASFDDNFTNVQLFRTPLAGGPPEPLSPTANQAGHIRFSEDGTYVFFALRLASTSTVYRLTLADLTLASLYSTNNNLPGEGDLILPSTGNRIVVVDRVSADSPTVPVYSVAYDPIAEPLLLTDKFGFNNTGAPNAVPSITLSPDETSLLFTEPSANGYFLDRVPISGATGPVRLLPAPVVQAFTVAKEGAGVFLVLSNTTDNTRQELGYLPFSGGAPLRLYAEVEGAPLLRLVEPLTGQRALFETTFETGTQLHVATLDPAVRFASRTSAAVAEGASRTLTVEMLPVSTETLTFTYQVVSGTATLGEDFTISPEVLTFAPGQITQTLTIDALTDTNNEPLETVTLSLTGEGASDPTTVTVSIADGVIPISDDAAQYAASSSNGRYVVYKTSGDAGIALYSHDLRTGATTLLQEPDGTLTEDGSVDLSPDGLTVLYETTSEVRRIPIQGTTSNIVAQTNGCPSDVQYTSDNEYAIVLVRCDSGDDTIVRADLDTYNLATLLRSPDIQSVTLSPANDYLLYRKAATGEAPAALGIRPLGDGSASEIAAPVGSDIAFADFTPANTVTYVVRAVDQGTVYRVPLPIGDPTMLGTIEVNGDLYALNNLRDTLLFTYNTTIRRFSLSTGVQSDLITYTSGGEIAYQFRDLQWVPQADRLAYVVKTDNCPVYGCTTTFGIHSITPNGQDRIFTTTSLTPTVRVGADGQYLAYNLDNGTIAASKIDGSVLNTVLDVPNVTEGSFLLGTRRLYSEAGDTLTAADVTGNYTETLFIDPLGHTLVATQTDDLLFFNDSAGRLYVTGDQAPKVGFVVTGTIIQEGNTATITVRLAASPLTPVTVDYALTDGTATNGQDFLPFSPGTLTFAPFERSKTFTITPINDGIEEPSETARFTLSNVTGGRNGDIMAYTLTIADQLYRQNLPLMQRR